MVISCVDESVSISFDDKEGVVLGLPALKGRTDGGMVERMVNRRGVGGICCSKGGTKEVDESCGTVKGTGI